MAFYEIPYAPMILCGKNLVAFYRLELQTHPCHKVKLRLREIAVHFVFLVSGVIAVNPCIGFVFHIKNIVQAKHQVNLSE